MRSVSLLSRAREGGSRTPVVVIGLALAVACLSAIALYSSPDAVKARESEARLAAAQAGADTAPPPALETGDPQLRPAEPRPPEPEGSKPEPTPTPPLPAAAARTTPDPGSRPDCLSG